MNSVIRNLPYYSLGAWFGATLMTCVKAVPLRRHLLMASLLTVLAVGAWLFNISLLLSLVSIVVIMKLFYRVRAAFRYAFLQPAECDWLQHHCYLYHPSHSGRNIQLKPDSANERGTLVAASRTDAPADLPLCQFVDLYCCGLAGRKLSQRAFSDLLFSPPSLPATVSYSPLKPSPQPGRFNC